MTKAIVTSIFSTLLLMPLLCLSAQEEKANPIITGVPTLMIAPDARAGSMGDVGAASSPDVYSQYWNAAKYAFASKRWGASMSYTPWLRKVVNDMTLMQAVGYYKLGNDDNQSISASVRYFDAGDILLADLQGKFLENASPYELGVDVGYARKLTHTFSASVAFRYIRADHTAHTDEETAAGNAFAADIAGYNESYINLFNSESLLAFGFNISNIGTKISNGGYYKSFIPTNMRIGASLMQPLDAVNTLSFSLDFNKLLVPAPPIRQLSESDDSYNKRLDKHYGTGAISGIFKSLGDGNFSEEMKEISMSVGAEYMYNRLLMLRTGYYHENKDKGNRQYATFGAGIRWQYLQLDMAYVLATRSSNPLDQTLRFSLAVSM